MSRFVSLLLVPFFVLGQCLPHSHAETGVAEPDGHALRPHVHLHSHGHSHDDHDEHGDDDERGEASDSTSSSDVLLPAADHDSDAVYLASSGQLLTRSSGAFGIKVPLADRVNLSPPIVVDTRLRRSTSDLPDRYATVPIYLLTASLRL